MSALSAAFTYIQFPIQSALLLKNFLKLVIKEMFLAATMVKWTEMF